MNSNITFNRSIQYSLIGGACHLMAKVLDTETLNIDTKKRCSLKIMFETTAHIANLIFVYSCIQGKLRFVGGIHYSFWSSFALVVKLASYVTLPNQPTQSERIEHNSIFFFANVFFAVIDIAAFSWTAAQFLHSESDLVGSTMAMGLQIFNQLFEKIIRFSTKCGSLFESEKSVVGIEEIHGNDAQYYEGRKELIKDLLCFSSLDTSWRNALLIGPPGCGKTQLIKHLACLIKKGQVPHSLKGSRVFNLSTSAFTTGCSLIGMVEERVDALFTEFKKIQKTLDPGKVIVFIDEMWQLIGAGQGIHATTDVSGRLLTLMEDNPSVVLIGATTPEEFRLIVDRAPAFANRLHGFVVPHLTLEEKISVAKACLDKHKNSSNCSIPEEVLVNVMQTDLMGASCRDIMKTLPLALAYMNQDRSSESVSNRFRKAVCRAQAGRLEQLKGSGFFQNPKIRLV